MLMSLPSPRSGCVLSCAAADAGLVFKRVAAMRCGCGLVLACAKKLLMHLWNPSCAAGRRVRQMGCGGGVGADKAVCVCARACVCACVWSGSGRRAPRARVCVRACVCMRVHACA